MEEQCDLAKGDETSSWAKLFKRVFGSDAPELPPCNCPTCNPEGIEETKPKHRTKSGKKNIYGNMTFRIEKDIEKLMVDISKKTMINQSMLMRPFSRMLNDVMPDILECHDEADITRLLRRKFIVAP